MVQFVFNLDKNTRNGTALKKLLIAKRTITGAIHSFFREIIKLRITNSDKLIRYEIAFVLIE